MKPNGAKTTPHPKGCPTLKQHDDWEERLKGADIANLAARLAKEVDTADLVAIRAAKNAIAMLIDGQSIRESGEPGAMVLVMAEAALATRLAADVLMDLDATGPEPASGGQPAAPSCPAPGQGQAR